MKEKKEKIALVGFISILWLGLSCLCFTKKPEEYSFTERRTLARFPKVRAESLSEGKFMEEFEVYSQDQFPFREGFRRIKAWTFMKALGKLDNNGIYLVNGQLSKLDYPLKKAQVDYALGKMQNIYDTYLEGKTGVCYLVVIPDKNYYLAEKNGYPAMDYETLFTYMEENTPYLQNLDIRKKLGEEDFYFTDTHWRQERLLLVAGAIAEGMGRSLQKKYSMKTLEVPFYGVYAGQSAFGVEPDVLRYLTSPMLESCIVTSYDTGRPVKKSVYDWEKLYGKDAYEFFLSGSDALLTIENPQAEGKGELIVFRDSFGSSLIPLLAECYEKITLVDIRYINSSLLGEFIRFDGQEVLFLYSTLLLNSSMGMK